ncbi:MAG: ArnT family glycosyltransferase [Akkermansiaceae bacterium]
MSTSSKVGGVETAVLVRRLLFFVVIAALVWFYLILTFRGLTTARGIEQAQIGREIARGHDATTKVIRPAAVWKAEQVEGVTLEFDDMYDTYHSPLGPFVYGAVLKLVGGEDFDRFQMVEDKRTIYRLDQVIAAVAVIFFLISIGVNYLLISRIFDGKIAGVTALLMIFCDLMWKFTHTGLPTMFMLLLFSCALFFIYRALEASIENRGAIGAIIIASVFLALLALAHWLTIWITLGFILYAAFFFKPKGVSGLLVIGILFVFSLYFMGKNLEWTGSPTGVAGMTIYGGLTESEEALMRTSDPSEKTYRVLHNLNSLILNTSSSMLQQTERLYNNFGAIVSAPLFFFALLHPFKRESIAKFRWIVLLMWFMAALGMALYGLSEKATDSNQLHILFAPIMAAYGLAFISILWSRLDLPAGSAFMRYGHFVIVVLVSAGPLLLSIPQTLRVGLANKGEKRPVWPPYWPGALNRTLHDATEETDIIFSDQPWAVAWYADRLSIWMPRRVGEFEYLEDLAADQKLNTSGILISPTSFESNPLYYYGSFGRDEDFGALLLNGAAIFTREDTGKNGVRYRDPKIKEVISRYPAMESLVGSQLLYYSKQPIIRGIR